jgi:hypothetical protein
VQSWQSVVNPDAEAPFAATMSRRFPPLDQRDSAVTARYLVKNPTEVPAADLADFSGREAPSQQLCDGRLEESDGLAAPGGVGGLAGPGRQDVAVAADADVVNADGVRQRLDARDVLDEADFNKMSR